MTSSIKINTSELAIRAHDISVCLERNTVPEFDRLTLLGLSTRLALHLRGVQAIPYPLIRDAAVYLLDFPSPLIVPTVLKFLAEADFVKLDTEGQTIKTVIPDIPYYDALFIDLGSLANTGKFSEPEQLTFLLMHRLAESPMLQDHAYQFGADKALVNRVIDIGGHGAFIIRQRARGRHVLLSPTYFPENREAYSDLVASSGADRLTKVLNLLKNNQGWPLSKIEADHEISGTTLDDKDLAVIRSLAGDGFLPPPAIQTNHAGTNYFLFGPRPGVTRLAPTKRPIYEAAMSLVAAVRQGQLLPARYAIRSPEALLSAFKDRGFIRANTEAIEQYRQVAALRVGRLQETSSGWGRLELVQRPENYEAIDLAIQMVKGEEATISPREDIILALREGESYVESLIGRKRLLETRAVAPDPETQSAIDAFLLRGF